MIKEFHRIFGIKIWSNKIIGKSKHWPTREKLYLPKQEGGLSFRSMFDVSKEMYAKLWWRFMTQNTTLRSNFMWTKYCKNHIPTLAEWKGRSQLWKNVLHNKECIEKFQWWETKSGISSVWYDNRTQLGPLYTYQIKVQTCHSLTNIDFFLKETG